MKSYVEFVKSMTKEQKEKANKLFEEIFEPYKNHQPLICVSRNKDDVKYVKKIKLDKK